MEGTTHNVQASCSLEPRFGQRFRPSVQAAQSIDPSQRSKPQAENAVGVPRCITTPESRKPPHNLCKQLYVVFKQGVSARGIPKHIVLGSSNLCLESHIEDSAQGAPHPPETGLRGDGDDGARMTASHSPVNTVLSHSVLGRQAISSMHQDPSAAPAVPQRPCPSCSCSDLNDHDLESLTHVTGESDSSNLEDRGDPAKCCLLILANSAP